jgi:hypothetical protein
MTYVAGIDVLRRYYVNAIEACCNEGSAEVIFRSRSPPYERLSG